MITIHKTEEDNKMKIPAKFFGINVKYDPDTKEISAEGKINKFMLEIVGRIFRYYSDINKKLTGKDSMIILSVRDEYRHLL